MDCKTVYEKIKTVLEKHKSDFELLEYTALQAYIDLLFCQAMRSEDRAYNE